MEQIKKLFQKFKLETIISSILLIALGVLFMVFPSDSTDALCTVGGIILICISSVIIIASIAYGFLLGGHLLISGVSFMLLGIFCLVYPDVIKNILPIIFGVYIVIDGSISLVDSLYCASARISGWVVLLLISIVTIALGGFVMFSTTLDTITMVAGICLIVDGVCDLVKTLVFSRKVRTAKKKFLEGYNYIDLD